MEVTNQLVKSVVRLQTEKSLGTGFIFSFAVNGEQFVPAIVTNRHVLEGANILQIVLSANDSNYRRIHETYQIQNIKDGVIFHPDKNIDLAVVPIISLLEQFRDETSIVPEIAYLDRSLLPKEEDIKKLKTIEDVLVIGYPNGLWDKINNQPLVRRGITASDYKVDFNGERKFIIDCSIFPGSSGSPVFLLIDGMWSDGAGNVELGRQKVFLLGINSAVFTHQADGKLVQKDIPTSLGVSTAVPNNLGIIIKSIELDVFENILWERAYGKEN
jgi:S1-C subfamily serine protease